MTQQAQPMDKRSIFGFVLIGIIITAWMMYQSITTRPTEENASKQAKKDTKQVSPEQAKQPIIKDQSSDLGKYFSPFAANSERFFTVETDLYIAKISSKGGTIASWKLKNYDKWDKKSKVDLIKPYAREFGLAFSSTDGNKIDAKALTFELTPAKTTEKSNYTRVYGKNSFTLYARLSVAPGSEIVKAITFHGDGYSLDADIAFNNMESYVVRSYDVTWNKGLQYQEENSVNESSTAIAMVSLNGSINELNADNFSDEHKTNFTGKVDYLAVRNKYFLAAIQPVNASDATVYLEGKLFGAPDKGNYEEYSLAYRVPVKPGKNTEKFTVYCGPQEYDRLSEYNLESTIDLGWRWLVAPIGEYFMLPIFKFIHTFIPNYGISIIIFSILMKLLLSPLTAQQLKTTQKMQLLAPELAKIREKYADDTVAQQQESMKLYGEYGINPAGGCFPMLLQMPILYALWAVLSSNVEIRNTYFFGWIDNLSVPDVIFQIPFQLPLVGIDKFSGLAFIMGATLFIQQKMSVTDPRQKAMIYIMPVMFTVMFSSFPAGLNLYYLIFNLLGIIQQVYVTKYAKNRLTLADLRSMPKKESWLQKRLQMAQEIAASQGKSLPGQPMTKSNQQKKNTPKKK